MDLSYTAEEQAFRAEVRAFLEAEVPEETRAKLRLGRRLCKDDMVRWQKTLHRRGWGAGMWPKRFGGGGWSVVQQYIFEEESAAASAPPQIPFGLRMVAPVIMTFGNAAQQQRFLPRIIAGEDWWCQGYSEPGSGSDLASLRMSALRQGDHYLVNGQKTWNTLGQYADWIFCLVRTSNEGRPQQGISFLLIDMKTPGVSVRPIITLDGEHEINDIFFESVPVPVANLVGEENQGWTYAKFLLNYERTNNAGVGHCKRALTQLKMIATAQSINGRPLMEDARFRDRIAQVELELMALEITNLRVLSAFAREDRPPGPEVSALKVKGSEIVQQLAELKMRALGHDALPYLREALEPDWVPNPLLATHYPGWASSLSGQYFNLRKATIYAGSTEIQKNVICKMILGL
ncbi:MAG TPA: acyl-CoA dehydrogenase family protein [Steroidobacteraceae bacterium]|jgi:alkylation response protein AidB-like acyl-CoA dehydrogenase|nr:acyl-CoA dehydrogenase family protein [Steroidobacteraceae bacterium]